jgi:short-subunit dehydrogenase
MPMVNELPKFDLRHKNVIVTGASRGLGLEIAKVLAQKEANLLLVARDQLKLESVAAELSVEFGESAEINLLATDISLPNATDAIMKKAESIWGYIFGLVNNAAILGPIGKLWENSWDLWQATITVNLLVPVALCRACVPWMAFSGGGKIVNLSGGGATGPRPNFSAYAVAKTGIVRFTEILAA